MKAWNIDADNLKLENTIIDDPILVHNKIINNYLNIGLHDNKFFIVAPKGFGKTLLLKIKSQKYRQNKSYTCIPKTSLCERMVDSVSYFNTQELNKFEDDELWKDIWSLCINIMILKNVEKDSKLPNSIIDIVGNADSLSDILRLVLSNRKDLSSLIEINTKFLNPKVKKINKPVAIFIDNIDEALDNHVGVKLKSSIEIGKTTKSLSHKVWINAQLGIIKAILNTYISNRHIKIFTSIRLEAFTANDVPTGMQINDYTSILEYDKKELEEIFVKNIEYTENSDVYNSEETDYYLKFLGITEIEHTSITDINGHTVAEPIFDYILRHTFRRPREIVLMGKRLSEMKKNDSLSNKKLKDEIRKKVNKVSLIEILEQYQNEIIPYCNREYFNLFCANAQKNILYQNDLKEIDQKVFQAGQAKGLKELKNISSALYHMGLIGYAEEEVITKEESVDHNYKQTFLPIARYLKKDKDLPTAPSHFFIHPSLYHKICKHVDSSVFYNKNNVVGYDRPFFPPNNGKPMHVHFGLSHRSLCLLIPSLNQRNNLAIIQSPDNEFFLDEQLSKQKTLKLIINENIEINCVILNENFRDYDLEIAEIIAKWKSGSNVLIYSSDLKTINNFIQLADTISTSKNNGGWSTKENNEFGKLLNLIPKDKNINLFAFEKNQTSHQNIVKYLNTHKPKVSVFRSMVDVYYYGKESQIGDSKNIEISIAGEIEQDNYAPFYFVADLDTISKTFSNNDGRFNFRNNLSDERMDYYVARYYLLTDAIYFLCKCYLNTGKNYSEDAIKSHFKKILDIYIQTTVEYLMTKYQKTIADTYNESKQNLIKFGQNSFQRFLKLPEDRQNHNIGQRSLQQLWKKLKKYNDFNFHESLYEYLDQGAKNTEMSDFFKSFNEFSKLVELRKNVNTDENKTKWKSVFLCYSRIEKDRIFVDNIYNGLKTLGIDVFKYNYDADPGQINFDMINEEIESRDNFLFIATENSILRNWCHIEIEMWRNKHKCDKNDDTPHFIHIPNAFKTVENYSVNFIPGKLLEAIPAMGENQISRTWKKVITQTNTTIDLPLLREQIKQKCIRNIEELKNRGITDTFCQNISSSDLQTFMITLKDFADRNFKKDS